MSTLSEAAQTAADTVKTAREDRYVAERKFGQHAILQAERDATEQARVLFEARVATRMQTATDIALRAEYTAKLAALDSKLADAEE